MFKIIFINSIDKYKSHLQIPIGILSLATVLKNEDYDVEIIDFNHLFVHGLLETGCSTKENISIMGDYILKKQPSIVCFYTMCNSYHNSLILSKYIKDRRKNIKVLFGGPQASLTSEISLKAFPWVDVIGIGEGEKTISKIIQAIKENKELKDIPGIAYREKGTIKCNVEPKLIHNLDELPYINYSLVPIEDYNSIAIDAGRGCPFECTYCSTKTFWKRRFRLKSPERLIREIKILKEKYHKKKFDMIHDLFTANKGKIIEFCNMLINQKLNIEWSCSARIDTLDDEIVERMKTSGCKKIYLGIETGSQRMQNEIKKNLNLDTLWEKLEILKRHNIDVTLSFIYGFPNERIDDVRQTLDIIQKGVESGISNIQLHFYTVLVGTEIYNTVKDNLYFMDYNSDIVDSINIQECKEMIEQNPDIFSQFFNFETEVRRELLYLDRFITSFYINLRRYLKSTFKLLLDHYNQDLLKLFIDFRRINYDKFNNIFNTDNYFFSSMTSYELMWEMIKIINKFLYSMDFNEKTEYIREIFRFEVDCFEYMYIKNYKDVKFYRYNYDILNILKDFNIKCDQISTPIKVKFYIGENGNLKVKRIKSYTESA
ncbi:B12-binding domain-containing radical SAM protein [Paramaledivibacter caminithermalis]|jgi:radical SAM superfamily enzyme YgiQ (UPF0313 family)|uniref:Radical SAM superfamily enzyme YgiQ, UPF0313 family n=1 Tax=Paramaledivibacter caminithermalis (strain DSM 15212 / CIP 107654 / DViRD3) TaxID=1121301 RepID=A0A1M6P3H4_PARC5|nr:radical SAM protein [Paramaledivibacter caminithermalis]SHK02432.1 Radical SAM superfamily enzyme YgiQ, UPF0313 family [Paramaledivibacter caminithermalis DSM 15212]